MTSLQTILRLNAASCILFGIAFVLWPAPISAALGEAPVIALRGLGAILVLNGGFLSFVSMQSAPNPRDIILFSLGDLMWWLFTVGLIATETWITTPLGITVALIVGIGVAMLGVLQLWALGLARSGQTSRQHFAAIAKSWMAMTLWVKIWLIALNGVFLWSILYRPSDFAGVTLLAFVATGPLLAGQIAHDGGLRRILGLAHLVPWLPFLIWLLWQETPTGYAQLLTATLAICLAFDAYDVVRFWRGDRAILGSNWNKTTQIIV